jgi:DNA polymerase-3 subunit gamma/tau
MRDGLSLLDQALAFGNESLRENDVAEMLGSLDRARVISLLNVLAKGRSAEVLGHIGELEELVPDYSGLLEDLATCLQQVAVIQLAGSDALEDEDQLPALSAVADALDPETTQLLYQIAIMSRRDLALAPDARIGFEMAMLRMLAFQPAGLAVSGGPGVEPAPKPTPAAVRAAPAAAAAGDPVSLSNASDWTALVQRLNLDGAARQLAAHTQFLSLTPFELRLSVDRANSHLVTEKLKSRLTGAIQGRLGEKIAVHYDLQEATQNTLAARDEKRQGEALRRARQAIESDPNVRDLANVFGAEVIQESIKPVAADPGDQT